MLSDDQWKQTSNTTAYVLMTPYEFGENDIGEPY